MGNWYSSLIDFDKNEYKAEYDFKRLVNPLDLGDPWMSKVPGHGTARYAPFKGVSTERVKEIEKSLPYIDFGNALKSNQNAKNTWIKQTDALLPENSLAKIEGNNTWITTNNNTLGVPGETFTDKDAYINHVRNDGLAGTRHNIFPKVGKRYYYVDANDTEHWVNPEVIENYTINEAPREIKDSDSGTIWYDYKLTGLKGDATGLKIPSNEDVNLASLKVPSSEDIDLTDATSKCIKYWESQGYPLAQAVKLCSGSSKKSVLQKNDDVGDVGRQEVDPDDSTSGNKGFWSKIGSILTPGLLSSLRVITDNFTNLRNTEELNSHLRPPLLTPWQAHKAVYGDYIAKRLGEQLSARLESMASRPMTSDASLQLAGQLEAVDKGALQVLAGLLRDAALYYKTRDEAINQAILNLLVRTQVANTNRQLLSLYEAMKAHNIFNAKLKNRLNRDRWWALWEDRALAEYDYQRKLKQLEREHLLAQKLGLQEKMDSVSDLLGVDDTELNAAISTLGDTTDPTARLLLLQKIKELTKRRLLQIYRNMGDRLGIQWNKLWSDLFNTNEIGKQLAKNGGVLRKLQQGGGLPMVEWTPLMGRPYLQYLSLQMTNSPLLNYYSGASGYSSSSRSSSSSSSSDKEENTIIKNIVETLKGVNGLNSDVNKLASELSNFLDVQRYLPDDLSTDLLYSLYLNALVRLNSVKRSAETFKNAEQAVTQNGGLHEYAVDSNGNVYVGTTVNGEPKVINVTLDDYRKNAKEKGYRLLTNNDLLYLRDNLFAFDDTISSTVSNGIGMELIGKYIKDFVGNLGTSKEARDRLIYHFGELALVGFNTLKELLQKGFTNEETTALIAKGIDGLWELHTIDSNLRKQLSAAVSAISETMPENMKTLIKLKTGSSVPNFVGKMLISGASDTTEFTIKDITALDETGKLKSSTKTGSGGNGDSDLKKVTVQSLLLMGLGNPKQFVISTGQDTGWYIEGNEMPLTDTSNKLFDSNVVTLDQLGGIYDVNNAYMGKNRISVLDKQHVLLPEHTITRAAIPITNDESGNIKPNFDRLKLVSEADKIVRDKLRELNITEGIKNDYSEDLKNNPERTKNIINIINKAYEDKKLPLKFNPATGKLNKLNYAYYGLISNAITERHSFEHFTEDNLTTRLKDEEIKKFEELLKSTELSEKYKVPKPWYSWLPWADGSEVYKGTLFIPLINDYNVAQSGLGTSYEYGPETSNSIDALLLEDRARKASNSIGKPLTGPTNFNKQ